MSQPRSIDEILADLAYHTAAGTANMEVAGGLSKVDPVVLNSARTFFAMTIDRNRENSRAEPDECSEISPVYTTLSSDTDEATTVGTAKATAKSRNTIIQPPIPGHPPTRSNQRCGTG